MFVIFDTIVAEPVNFVFEQAYLSVIFMSTLIWLFLKALFIQVIQIRWVKDWWILDFIGWIMNTEYLDYDVRF